MTATVFTQRNHYSGQQKHLWSFLSFGVFLTFLSETNWKICGRFQSIQQMIFNYFEHFGYIYSAVLLFCFLYMFPPLCTFIISSIFHKFIWFKIFLHSSHVPAAFLRVLPYKSNFPLSCLYLFSSFSTSKISFILKYFISIIST